jgi:hypothetical protein
MTHGRKLEDLAGGMSSASPACSHIFDEGIERETEKRMASLRRRNQRTNANMRARTNILASFLFEAERWTRGSSSLPF